MCNYSYKKCLSFYRKKWTCKKNELVGNTDFTSITDLNLNEDFVIFIEIGISILKREVVSLRTEQEWDTSVKVSSPLSGCRMSYQAQVISRILWQVFPCLLLWRQTYQAVRESYLTSLWFSLFICKIEI